MLLLTKKHIKQYILLGVHYQLKLLPTNKEIRTAGRNTLSCSRHAGAVGSAHGNCQDGVGVAHARSLEGEARFSASHTRRKRIIES